MASKLSIDWQDPNRFLSGLLRQLSEEAGSVARVPGRAVRKGVFMLLRLWQRETPKVTGTLTRSETAAVAELGPDLVEGRVGSPMKYARFVEEGTGLYGPRRALIVPKGGKALKFVFGGEVLYRRNVKGMKAQRPLGKAVESFAPQFAALVEEELKK